MTLIVKALMTLIIANLIILCNRHVRGAERIHEQYPLDYDRRYARHLNVPSTTILFI